MLGVREPDLQGGVLRQFVPFGPLAGPFLDEQRQHLEGLLAALPAEVAGPGGELRARRVAGPTAVRGGVPGVADQLLVDDPGGRTARPVGGEHRDHGADPPAVGGGAQVVEALGGDVVGGGEVAQVAHHQAAPVQPADAAGGVAPGEPGAVGEFGGGVLVGAGAVDLVEHGADPGGGVAGAGLLAVELPDELGRLPWVGEVVLVGRFRGGGARGFLRHQVAVDVAVRVGAGADGCGGGAARTAVGPLTAVTAVAAHAAGA